MLKLYGFPVSNYVNMVNLALLEKGLPFDFVLTIPDQSPEFLAKSPRGKVPCLETAQGFISEASVILEYLEEIGTGKALLRDVAHIVDSIICGLPIGWLAPLWDAKRQTWADKILNTYVVTVPK